MTSHHDDMSPVEQRAYDGLVAAADLAHLTASRAGWYKDPATGQPIARNFGEVVALMHSELSEALEAFRKSLDRSDKIPEIGAVEEEFADCIIRILDTAKALELDVPRAVILKNRFNQKRSDHKLENRAAPGGKRF
jgi:NTP pyrophosphatase (non-canonical NTP hydrolase)